MSRAALLLLLLVSARPLLACELCDGPGSSFASLQSQIEAWPVAATGEPVGRQSDGRVEFRVTRILKGGAELKTGQTVSPQGAWAAPPGRVWLLLGSTAEFQSSAVLMLRPATLDFLLAAPGLPPKEQPAKRLAALLPWLRHADPMVAASARQEFAAAPYDAVKAVSKDVAGYELAAALENPKFAPRSRGTWFLLLGLVGRAPERRMLATWMKDPEAQKAPGYDALLAAWIQQTGLDGLVLIRETLAAPTSELDLVGSAYVRALGFHARNETVLTGTQVTEELCRLLASPVVFSDAVMELTKLEAWNSLDAVLRAHERHKAETPWIIGATLRFLAAHPADAAKAHRARIETEVLGGVPKASSPPAK